MNQPIDMSRFIEAKSDQLNADDLIGTTRTITITRVVGCEGDQPIAIYYEGDNGKPFKPCKTVRRVLMNMWGRYANEYVGKSMTLYRDDEVTFGGLKVGGIRVSAMSGIDKESTVVVMKSKGKKVGMKIKPLTDAPATSAALSQDQARCDIANAASLDELQMIWRRPSMRPHREALQSDLDARKSQLTDSPNAEEGRADEDHGDQHDGGPFEGEG